MTPAASIPQWARNRRTFISVNVALGIALAALLAGVALIAPTALRSIVIAVFSPLLLLGLALVLLVVGGVRRVVLGPARKQKLPANAVFLTYVFAALPLCVATLSLGVLVILALVFQWPPRFDLVLSFVLLVVAFVMFSLTMKTVLNLQLLVRHWSGR